MIETRTDPIPFDTAEAVGEFTYSTEALRTQHPEASQMTEAASLLTTVASGQLITTGRGSPTGEPVVYDDPDYAGTPSAARETREALESVDLALEVAGDLQEIVDNVNHAFELYKKTSRAISAGNPGAIAVKGLDLTYYVAATLVAKNVARATWLIAERERYSELMQYYEESVPETMTEALLMTSATYRKYRVLINTARAIVSNLRALRELREGGKPDVKVVAEQVRLIRELANDFMTVADELDIAPDDGSLEGLKQRLDEAVSGLRGEAAKDSEAHGGMPEAMEEKDAPFDLDAWVRSIE